MDTISLDPELAKKLDAGMRSGDTVELPFPVVYVWALNGQASYKAQGGALYFGGWAAKVEDMQAVADQQGLAVPADWKEVTIASRDGGEFQAFTRRALFIAPIGKRESWLLDGKRASDYIEGGRRHLQVLAYISEKVGQNGSSHFEPWGPVIITAKGYQAGNLLDAFASWNKATSALRWKAAPGVPAWCFYFSLGTYGKERKALNVGKPGAQSPITPISAWIPEKMTPETMAGLFVGGDIAALMAELQDQAAEWLKAWEQPGPVVAGGPDAPEVPDENWANGGPDEEVPF